MFHHRALEYSGAPSAVVIQSWLVAQSEACKLGHGD